jgi:hypothetical protein
VVGIRLLIILSDCHSRIRSDFYRKVVGIRLLIILSDCHSRIRSDSSERIQPDSNTRDPGVGPQPGFRQYSYQILMKSDRIRLDRTMGFYLLGKHNFFWKTWLLALENLLKKSNLYSSMQFHFLFQTVKTAGPDLISIKSYSKNTHPSSFLKWIIVKKTRYYVFSLFILKSRKNWIN